MYVVHSLNLVGVNAVSTECEDFHIFRYGSTNKILFLIFNSSVENINEDWYDSERIENLKYFLT